MYNEYLKEELLFEYKGKNGGESRERIIQYCCASSILNLCLFNLFISSSRTFRLTPGIKLSNCLSDIPSAIAVIISSLIAPLLSSCAAISCALSPNIWAIVFWKISFPFVSAKISPIVEFLVYTFGMSVTEFTVTLLERTIS